MRKTIAVTVTYNVEIETDIPDDVAESLQEIVDDQNGFVQEPDIYYFQGREDLSRAAEWLTENINENAAMNIEYEIDELRDAEDDEDD